MNQWEQDYMDALAADEKWEQLNDIAARAQAAAREYERVRSAAYQKYYRSIEAYKEQLKYKKERGL